MANFYDNEITNVSFQELQNFLTWMNRRGSFPTIIGGWAVYAYEGGLGSRDIDVVMPDTTTINQLLEDEYFLQNQFQVVKKGFIPDHYRKVVQTKQGDADIIFDVFNAENPREDSEGLGISLQWSWTLEFQEQKQIEKLDLYVPKRELLIILKIIAALGRTEELRTRSDLRLISKIWKDYRDIAILAYNKNLDNEFLKEYLKKTNVANHMPRFVTSFQDPRYNSILEELNCKYEDIKAVLSV